MSSSVSFTAFSSDLEYFHFTQMWNVLLAYLGLIADAIFSCFSCFYSQESSPEPSQVPSLQQEDEPSVDSSQVSSDEDLSPESFENLPEIPSSAAADAVVIASHSHKEPLVEKGNVQEPSISAQLEKSRHAKEVLALQKRLHTYRKDLQAEAAYLELERSSDDVLKAQILFGLIALVDRSGKRDDEVEELYQQLIRLDLPSSTQQEKDFQEELILVYVSFLVDHERYREAETMSKQFPKTFQDPQRDARSAVLKMMILHAQERYQEAETLYRQALQQPHPAVEAMLRNGLAGLLFDLGRFDQAKSECSQGLETDGDVSIHVSLIGMIARILVEENSLEEAEERCEEAIVLLNELSDDPGVQQEVGRYVYIILAHVRMAQEEFEKVEKMCREILSTESFRPMRPSLKAEVYSVLAEDLLKQGKMKEALSACKSGLLVHTHQPWVRDALSKIYQEANGNVSSHVSLLAMRARILVKENSLQEAEECCEEAFLLLKELSDDSGVQQEVGRYVYTILAHIRIAQEEFEEAEKMCRELLLTESVRSMDPDLKAEVYSVLAESCLKQGKIKEAEERCKEAFVLLKELSDDPGMQWEIGRYVYTILAQALISQAECEEAEKMYSEFLLTGVIKALGEQF